MRKNEIRLFDYLYSVHQRAPDAAASGSIAAVAPWQSPRRVRRVRPTRVRRSQSVRVALIALLLGSAVVAACSSTERRGAPSASVESTPSAPAGILAGSEEVEIDPGGRTIVGRLFGSGEIGVVLAHGNRPGLAQAGMYELAAKLAEAGYTVLTFNFRSFCPPVGVAGCSEGLFVISTLYRDVEGAVTFLRERGIETVFVVGSSLGGTNALYAAAQPQVDLAGVVAVSAVQFPASGQGPPALTLDVLQQIDEPKLFIVAENDAKWADDSPAMFAAATEPKQLEVIPRTSAHGEDMLTGSQHSVVDKTTKLILDFLAANSP